MQFKTFTLDPFQEEAIQAIENNQSVVVSAPTGSGKTLIADYIIEKHCNDPKRVIYTAPIKALSNQKYRDFVKEYGEQNVGLMTGDIVINSQAKVLIMTTEIYRNMAVSQDADLADVAYVIFDEIHYINDPERGYVWEESVIYSSETVRFLCLSATIPNALEFSKWISSIKHHPVKTVTATKRNVPLEHLFFDYELGITTLNEIKKAFASPEYRGQMKRGRKGKRERVPEASHIDLIRELGPEKLPCFFFSFSRRDCQQKAWELSKANQFQKDPKILAALQGKLRDAPPDIHKLNSTKLLKETISQGIAFHHAGLLPAIKQAVEELFGQGLIKVLYTTETFAVGINMPARTVCFNSLRKYDGRGFRNLNTKEYFQIAGRAGRRGIDPIGYVVSMIFRPTFNYEEIKKITDKDVQPIQSQFRLSVNTVLNLINLHTPQEIERILRLSFYSYQKFGEKYKDIPARILLARYYNIVRKLKQFGYVEDGKLTAKGIFSSKVYADEITLGEVFATDVASQLDEYQILLALASIVYEPGRSDEFKTEFPSESLQKLKKALQQNEYLAREEKFLELNKLTALIHPVYKGTSFFELLGMTNLLEGDLIRFFAQILDRIGQIRKATTDHDLMRKMQNCRGIIERALEGIYLVG